MRVKLINWGIASRVGGTVYLNKRLNMYPRLKSALISHEKSHSEDFTVRDIMLDLEIEELKGIKGEYYKFLFTTPSAWVEFIPIKKYEDAWLFNFPIFLAWLLFTAGVAWFLLAKLM